MPPSPAPGVAQFRVRGTLNGEQVENVFHILDVLNTTWSQPALLAEANRIRDVWIAKALPPLSVDYIWREVSAVDLSGPGGLTAVSTLAAVNTGGVVVAALPNNVALCVSHRTGRAGRSYRGRTYIPGLPESAVNNNRVDNGTSAQLVDAVRDILVRPPSSTLTGVVLSRFALKTQRPVALATQITSVLVTDEVIDSQRRRLPGRGS